MNIGLIGCGTWGKLILRDLVVLGCQVSVVATSKISIENANQFGAIAIFDNLDLLPIQHGYVVCTPSNTRFRIIQTIKNRHKDAILFTEKPLCADADEAELLKQQFPDSIFVMDKWRYHTGILKLKEIIKSEEFGKVVHIACKRLSRGMIHSDVDTIWNLAPHDLAITLELLGYMPTPVFARLDQTIGEVRGMTACLGQSPFVTVEVSDRHFKHCREVKVFFENAIATLSDAYSDHIAIYRTDELSNTKEPDFEYRKFEIRMPLLDELSAFIAHLKGGKAPKSSVADAALIVQTIVLLKRIAQ